MKKYDLTRVDETGTLCVGEYQIFLGENPKDIWKIVLNNMDTGKLTEVPYDTYFERLRLLLIELEKEN